jgi:hypothetical protein
MKTIFLVGFLIVSQSTSSRLLWAPPDNPDEEAPKATVTREFISRLSVGDFEVVLETTPIAAAQTRLGGTLGRRGDAASSLDWICRSGRDVSGNWMLWLESGEIHGNDVGAFELRRIQNTERADDRCSAAPPNEQVVLPVPIRLGMTEAQLRQVLGKPTRRRAGTLLYLHEHRLSPQGEGVVSNWLDVALDRGVVSSIRVWRITSD